MGAARVMSARSPAISNLARNAGKERGLQSSPLPAGPRARQRDTKSCLPGGVVLSLSTAALPPPEILVFDPGPLSEEQATVLR